MAPLEKHNLLKFLSLNKKFDHNLIRDFYGNLAVIDDRLECQFRNKLIKFTLEDFDTHFGLWAKGDKICCSTTSNFSKIDWSRLFLSQLLVTCWIWII